MCSVRPYWFLLRRVTRVHDWAIFGRFGHIYAIPDGFQFMIINNDKPRTARWTNVKQRMAFCQLTQDGDDEGAFVLNRLPTSNEAKIIREALAIPKARHLSEEQRAKLVAAGNLFRPRHEGN